MKITESAPFRRSLLIGIFFLLIGGFALQAATSSSVNVFFFWGEGCPHCEKVLRTEVLNEVEEMDGVTLSKLEVYNHQENRETFEDLAEKAGGGTQRLAVPFAVIECNKRYSYLVGDQPIINKLKEKVNSCEGRAGQVSDQEQAGSNTGIGLTRTYEYLLVGAGIVAAIALVLFL